MERDRSQANEDIRALRDEIAELRSAPCHEVYCQAETPALNLTPTVMPGQLLAVAPIGKSSGVIELCMDSCAVTAVPIPFAKCVAA